jgi:subtilisin family serine protease
VDTSNAYKGFDGTSAAAPHVAGAIALIYSTPCTTFLQNLETNPEGVALMVADIILNTGADNNSLEDITTTGKRVQVNAAMQATLTDCGVITEESVRIRFIAPNPSRENFAKIYFEVIGDTSTASLDLYSVNGTLVSTDPISQEEFQQGYIYLDTKPLASAIYLVTLRNKKNKATAKLFIP